MESNIRIAKKIAESGVASRREAEKLIKSGKVFVNNKQVSTPAFFVSDHDEIIVDGKSIPKKSEEIVIWKFHKPKGVITTKYDPQKRKTVFDFLKDINKRLISVGRLDFNSEGLLLFTNNGDLARKLELPSSGLKRKYRARIFGNLPKDKMETLKKGLTINGIKYKPIDVKIDKISGSANFWATITLLEGKNREIRKIIQYFGCVVNRLIRTGYGPFELGDLPAGKFSRLSKREISKLLNIVDTDLQTTKPDVKAIRNSV
ncbi:MAG: rRNA pseudouridine synthase [Holosporaceae bacterium]|nr:rRNA pseudouridine synthase [Holosporaceae bacterium]